MEELYEVVKEESTSTTCLEFSFLVFYLDLPPPPREDALPSPTYNCSPPLTQLTAAQPWRPNRVSSRELSLTVPTCRAQALARQGASPFAGCTLCTLPSPHTYLRSWWSGYAFSFPKASEIPKGKGQICMPQSAASDLGEYTFPNTSFLQNTCQWTLVWWGQMLNQWNLTQLFNAFWNPFSYWLPSYGQADVHTLRRSGSKRPKGGLVIRKCCEQPILMYGSTIQST